MKANQLKIEAKSKAINKSKTLTVPKKTSLNVTPPTSIQVIPSRSAQKRKSNSVVTPPKKAKSSSTATATFIKSEATSLPITRKPEADSTTPTIKTATFIQSQTSSPLPISKKPAIEPPSPKLSPISKGGAANARLKELQISLEKQQSILPSDEVLTDQISSNASCNQTEDMDWEPSDLSEVPDNNNENGTMSEYYESIDENKFKISSRDNCFGKSYSSGDFYFVVDTNVLLDNLAFVNDLSEKVFTSEFFSFFLKLFF